MRVPAVPILFASWLAACERPTAVSENGDCWVGDDIGPGEIAASIDGAAWSTGGMTWRWAGDSLQLNTPAAAGWMLSVVALADGDGNTAREALADLPASFALGAGADGAFALLYPDDGDTFATEAAAGGALDVAAWEEGGLLEGCVAFAAGDGASEVELADGRFRAEAD